MRYILLLFLFIPFVNFSQLTGKTRELGTDIPLFGIKIISEERERTISDLDGNFSLKINKFPTWIYFSGVEHQKDSLLVYNSKKKLTVFLKSDVQELKGLVVSASRRLQKIEEVPISMEIIKVELIDNKGLANLEQAVDLSPGVYAMDGQVSIRGGGGYAYGVGSRVLVLTNGMPLISPDLGDVKWTSIPMESVSQIEITKGASSVLYGSGALNGTIALMNREPTPDGELRVKLQSGIYDNPKKKSLIWWDQNPTSTLVDVYYGKMHKQVGYTVSGSGFFTPGYKDGEREDRGRLSGSFVYRPKKISRLKTGFHYNGQYENVGRFIIWESDSTGYTPSGGGSPNTNPNSSITRESSVRLTVDPYVKYFDKKGNRHELKGRYYLVSIGSPDGIFATSVAEMFYGDYHFMKRWGVKHTLTSGATASANKVRSSSFGDHNSINMAAYAQYDFKLKRFGATAGVRAEYFKQDNRTPDSQFDMWETKSEIPVYPVFRSALHYALTEHTHLRTSFGQGVRFPAVGERFTEAINGGVTIFPNPNVQPEKGWAAELGVKQVFKIGNWKGILDVAGFVNNYNNMIEFVFGLYNPESVPLTIDPEDPGYIYNWIGFKADNTEDARITGIETSFSSQGKIKNVELTSLIGYTYMNPVSLNEDSVYLLTFSDTNTRMLKYRFKHLVKADIQATYKNIYLGASARYNSFMSNIDKIFETELFGQEILPGLRDYRLENQEGSLVFDARVGYSFRKKYNVSFIVNNLLNTEYSSRPADLQSPRQFLVQLRYGL